MTFYVVGAKRNDKEQSKVLITISGKTKTGDKKENAVGFTVQTTVTQRLLYTET